MREIKTLIQQLKNYPNNLFVCVEEEAGLTVCNLQGEEQGFIEIGTNDGKVIV